MKTLLNIVKSPWFWAAVILLIVVLFIRANADRWSAAIKRVFAKDNGDYTEGYALAGGTEDQRKATLKALAQEAYAQLSAGVVNPMAREAAIAALFPLNDTELRFVATEYKYQSRDKSLFTAVDDAWMPFSDVDERLMARLANIAMT